MSPSVSPRSRYLRFVGVSVVTVAALALLGWIPTRRWAGDAGGPAVFVGCGISLVAALGSGWVIVRAADRSEQPPALAAFGAMGLRLGVTVILVLAVALIGAVPVEPLLIWVGVSYLALLALETRFAVSLMGEGGSRQAVDRHGEELGAGVETGDESTR